MTHAPVGGLEDIDADERQQIRPVDVHLLLHKVLQLSRKLCPAAAWAAPTPSVFVSCVVGIRELFVSSVSRFVTQPQGQAAAHESGSRPKAKRLTPEGQAAA